MSIRIDKEKCIGCGKCVQICPGNLLARNNERKCFIRYPRDCWGCTACLKECGVGAIQYFLGPDIGGTGSYLYTHEDKEMLHWHFVRGQGQEKVITIQKREANKY